MPETFTQAEVDALISAAVIEERSRISAITGSDLYVGREKLAQRLIDKGMASTDAIELMAVAPMEQPPQQPSANGAAQRRMMELLASESADVKPDASTENGGKPMTEDQRRLAEIKAAVPDHLRRKN